MTTRTEMNTRRVHRHPPNLVHFLCFLVAAAFGLAFSVQTPAAMANPAETINSANPAIVCDLPMANLSTNLNLSTTRVALLMPASTIVWSSDGSGCAVTCAAVDLAAPDKTSAGAANILNLNSFNLGAAMTVTNYAGPDNYIDGTHGGTYGREAKAQMTTAINPYGGPANYVDAGATWATLIPQTVKITPNFITASAVAAQTNQVAGAINYSPLTRWANYRT